MKWTKILILIVAFVIPLFTFAGCANENNKTPREWCEEEVKYWCEYDYGNDKWYFDIIGTATIPIDVSVETFDSDEYIYGVEAYDITVYYEKGNYSYIQKKSYIAVIFYEGNTKHIIEISNTRFRCSGSSRFKHFCNTLLKYRRKYEVD